MDSTQSVYDRHTRTHYVVFKLYYSHHSFTLLHVQIIIFSLQCYTTLTLLMNDDVEYQKRFTCHMNGMRAKDDIQQHDAAYERWQRFRSWAEWMFACTRVRQECQWYGMLKIWNLCLTSHESCSSHWKKLIIAWYNSIHRTAYSSFRLETHQTERIFVFIREQCAVLNRNWQHNTFLFNSWYSMNNSLTVILLQSKNSIASAKFRTDIILDDCNNKIQTVVID